MKKPDWPISGFEHRDYTETEIQQVITNLRRGYKLQPPDRDYLATLIEQLLKRILELRSENDKLEAACIKLQNG